ncbi:MAG: hypothetical protein FWF10_08270 [Clostridiales bacterium]|nr:hypothetical protein [Clostridiales bacterium]
MENTGISVYGHTYIRVFVIAEDGDYRDGKMIAGAHWLHHLLPFVFNGNGGSLDMESGSVKAFLEDDSKRREYIEYASFPLADGERLGYAVKRRMGHRGGAEPVFLGDGKDGLIIYDRGYGGLDIPLGYSHALWASNKALPNREQFRRVAQNCLLFLDAEVLRAAGAMISRGISWEKTASELIWQLQNNPVVSFLSEAPHILITFAEDGAVYIRRREDGSLAAALYLTHSGAEGSLREALQGEAELVFDTMTLILAAQFRGILLGTKDILVMPMLKAAKQIMTEGDMASTKEKKNISLNLNESDDASEEKPFPIPIEGKRVRTDWCVANSGGADALFQKAYDYVLHGAQVIEGLPRLSFGKLISVDRHEIEAYQNIRNLIMGYARGSSVQPLSIAVFGSPGSGKSFGVTEIAKCVLPGRVEKLEFNVSQFTGPQDLGAAFQRVRDAILEGKLPLVFFDEFDSDRGGVPLGWLKSFLMPMQDGKFKDESGVHPIGKCVLVFAGGTAADADDFVKEHDEGYRPGFKSAKGPDFVSRLKGTIGVLGPNRRNDEDENYVLRRALLLRSLCRQKGICKVNGNIVSAMLKVSEYKHGARSMEAILDMSRIDGDAWEPASLPFHSQLALHVEADEFLGLVMAV